LQTSQKRRDLDACLRIALGNLNEHTDAPCSLRLLRARREGPRRRAAEQRDEIAPPDHSITSSASARSVGGISRLSPLAVLRLMTSSNFVGCSTGRSAGFAPLRIFATYWVATEVISRRLGP